MDETFEVTLTRREDYRFDVAFNDPAGTSLVVDEPTPLGEGSGPNAARLLAGAVGNCLSASLLFCLQRAHVAVEDVRATVTGTVVRNDSGRLRIGSLAVRIEPIVPDVAPAKLQRCLDLFEDFCLVTQSVRQGIDVDVEVDLAGVGGAEADASATRGAA